MRLLPEHHKVRPSRLWPLLTAHQRVRCLCGWTAYGSADGVGTLAERHLDDVLAGRHVVLQPRWHWGLLFGLPALVRCSCGAWCTASREGCQEWREAHLREHSHG